jgi:excinuclease ABC subunit B
VGINLLREGLDMPEVSLVAILDADKEGFLRSAGSLIQTIGRAARNLRGTAILYADRVTNAMRQAMDETDRRRGKQVEYNTAHGIVPKSIVKKVTDVLEGARFDAASEKSTRGRGRDSKVAEAATDYRALSPEQFATRVKKLEAQMYKHAQNLEFEDAARLRDEIHRIREMSLLSG